MDKSKKKAKRQPYDLKRAAAVKWTAREFRVTEPYVRNVLNGLATYGLSDDIRRAFNKKYAELKQVLS